jgi:hypothetical protein
VHPSHGSSGSAPWCSRESAASLSPPCPPCLTVKGACGRLCLRRFSQSLVRSGASPSRSRSCPCSAPAVFSCRKEEGAKWIKTAGESWVQKGCWRGLEARGGGGLVENGSGVQMLGCLLCPGPPRQSKGAFSHARPPLPFSPSQPFSAAQGAEAAAVRGRFDAFARRARKHAGARQHAPRRPPALGPEAMPDPAARRRPCRPRPGPLRRATAPSPRAVRRISGRGRQSGAGPKSGGGESPPWISTLPWSLPWNLRARTPVPTFDQGIRLGVSALSHPGERIFCHSESDLLLLGYNDY